MNIFVLDKDPKLAAEYHCDKHVVKMVLETTQMLCTAPQHLLAEFDSSNEAWAKTAPVKATHKNHPCTKWVAESYHNYNWTFELLLWLHVEYENRYHKQHAWRKHLAWIKEMWNRLGAPILAETIGGPRHQGPTFAAGQVRWPVESPASFVLAMPDKYKSEDPVQSYRDYYLGEKAGFAKWRHGPTPKWWLDAS